MAKKTEQIKHHATHQGEININGIIIPCAVLENRERVISIRGIATALGTKGGGAYWKSKREKPDEEILPEFISAKNVETYARVKLPELIAGTISYRALSGQEAEGIKAEIIPDICDIWVKALSDGVLTEKQQKTAQQAHILLSAFAKLGVTALVDEATGYQKEKDEYQKLVERYIATELQPWIKTFGEDYYYQIYRLKGWDWDRFAVDRKNHPWAVANITNRIVYEKLPDGVLGALQDLNPANAKGNRSHRHFQHLSPDEGKVHLLKHLGAIVNIMERHDSGSWDAALHEIDTRFPSKRIGNQPTLPLDFHSADKKIFDTTIERASKPVQEEKRK